MAETSRPPTRPETRRRDPERTRKALLDAALVEFAEKGRSGARVSDIAARAGVNKQLISYYFGGKDGLYRALWDQWLAREAEMAPEQLAAPDRVASYALAADEDVRALTRMYLRECLDDAHSPDAPYTEGLTEEDVEWMRDRQRQGELADDLDPAMILMALQAAASVSVLFPEEVRRLTGLDPASPEFAERYAEQLRRLVLYLAR
jgi:AcrR family transcriptional regulator